MRAAVYIEGGRIETRDVERPRLGAGDVLLRVQACGVCGTDIRKVRYSMVKPPMILGHEVAGEVFEIGGAVTKFAPGDRIVVAHHAPCYTCHYCRHGSFSMCPQFKKTNLDPGGFAEYVRIPSILVEQTAHKIPANVTYDRAIHMEPLACILRDLKRTTIQPGDTVLVIGLGAIGLLTGQLVKRLSAKVIATDLLPDRRHLGARLGFDEVLDARDESGLERTLRRVTDGRGADLVVLTAGNAELYTKVMKWVRSGGTINLFAGLPPGEPLRYECNEFYEREITAYSSYSSSPTELTEALELLRVGAVDVDILETRSYPLENLAAAIEAVMSMKVMKAIVHPGGGSE